MPVLLPALMIHSQERASNSVLPPDTVPKDAAQSVAGFYGPYAVTREASGTSWQPEATPASGFQSTHGNWTWTTHAIVSAVYTHQGGRRGDDDIYSPNMLVFRGNRPAGRGTFDIHTTFTAESVSIDGSATRNCSKPARQTKA